jgi:hypothetical protein
MIHLTGDEAPSIDLNSALTESRLAVEKLIVTAARSGAAWATAPAPGKWSPSQIVEHVAMALEESGKNIQGQPSAFPSLPKVVRPVVRAMFFNRVLKKNEFIKGRTNKAMNPSAGPKTPVDGRERLRRAHNAFERACLEHGVRFEHGIFGNISTADYARFQALHTQHHTRQIPV